MSFGMHTEIQPFSCRQQKEAKSPCLMLFPYPPHGQIFKLARDVRGEKARYQGFDSNLKRTSCRNILVHLILVLVVDVVVCMFETNNLR